MKALVVLPLLAGVAASSAKAALPAQAVIDSCLSARSRGAVKFIAISTSESYGAENYRPGYQATYYQFRGTDVGLAQLLRRPDNDEVGEDSLIYAGKLFPLKKALQPGAKNAESLPRIYPYLSDWMMLQVGSRRYLCAGSNFDGIGRSGAHQNVRFGYLLSLSGPKTLYWFWGDIRQQWRRR